ncbi:MAG TPA: hypothetical protein DCZ40_13945 [Lachnospiraceae bacterium]|nr:hypothetical protein [Lachnospiraceae bacterium]
MRKNMGTDMVGLFAISKAGHDKSTVYVIVGEEDEYVYVADGKLKTIDRPKRKNKKHIQIVKKDADDILREKFANGQHIYNEEIKKAIGGFICQRQM